MDITLSQCFVIVTDPDPALAFYRDALGLDNVPGGVSPTGDDNIINDVSNGFGHAECSPEATAIAADPMSISQNPAPLSFPPKSALIQDSMIPNAAMPHVPLSWGRS